MNSVEVQCSLCPEPIKAGDEQVSFNGAPAHRVCFDKLEAKPLIVPEVFTIVKSYKVFNGRKAVREPMGEFDEDQLRFWLETHRHAGR